MESRMKHPVFVVPEAMQALQRARQGSGTRPGCRPS